MTDLWLDVERMIGPNGSESILRPKGVAAWSFHNRQGIGTKTVSGTTYGW